jgi:hypothetical protein
MPCFIPSTVKNGRRDSCEVSIASHESLEFVKKKHLRVTMLPGRKKYRLHSKYLVTLRGDDINYMM